MFCSFSEYATQSPQRDWVEKSLGNDIFSSLHCLRFWSHLTMGWYLQKKIGLKKFWHWYFSKFWSCHTVGVPVDPIIAHCCNQNSWLFSKVIFQIGGEFKFSPDGTTTTLRRMMMRAGRWMSRGTSTRRRFGTSSLGEAWTQAMSMFKWRTVLKKV